ncbi:Lsr2 family protein [Streptosporangiaceae bacterium NEAU-GS5]|nr:Lsr2 family protein [Streptosporangiaceae bacterium NEAU-GS5]
MARQTTVILIDDLDGSQADETVSFALDGTAYEIDLAEDKATNLRQVFAPFIRHARSVRAESTRSRRGGPAESPNRLSREQATEIRRWARENNLKISARGRVPANVVKAYQEAH